MSAQMSACLTNYNDALYRKGCKKIREIETLKMKKYLTEPEIEKVSKELFYKHMVRQNKRPKFEDLPQEMVNAIIEYLPYNTRLAILKRKYPKQLIKEILRGLRANNINLANLYPCAMFSSEILFASLKRDSDLYKKLKTNMTDVAEFGEHFVTSNNSTRYPHFYKDQFVELIINAIYHYTRIYKAKMPFVATRFNLGAWYSIETEDAIFRWRSEWVIYKKRQETRVEELVLKLYSHLDVILGLKGKIKET